MVIKSLSKVNKAEEFDAIVLDFAEYAFEIDSDYNFIYLILEVLYRKQS